jgi:uncharacterized membrane protein
MNPLRLCQFALAGLILLNLWWHGVARVSSAGAASDLGLALLPLLPVTAAWAFKLAGPWIYGGIAAWIYFCHGVMEAWVDPGARVLASAEIGLTLIYFAGLYLRTRELRAAKRAAVAGNAG